MDAQRFDSLVKTLRTRRSALGLVASVSTLLGLVVDETAAKKCKKKCGPCRLCKKGRCRKKIPDGTPCLSGGTCLAGQCCIPNCAEQPCNSSDGCGGNCSCNRGQSCVSGTCEACPTDAECTDIPCGETRFGGPCRCTVSVDGQPACVSIGDHLTKFNVVCSDAQCTIDQGKTSFCIDGQGCPFEGVSRFWCFASCEAV
jgi:hypothetical protein